MAEQKGGVRTGRRPFHIKGSGRVIARRREPILYTQVVLMDPGLMIAGMTFCPSLWSPSAEVRIEHALLANDLAISGGNRL